MLDMSTQKISEVFSPTEQQAHYLMRSLGWVIFRKVLPVSFVQRLKTDLEVMYQKRRQIQLKNGIGDVMSGTSHHLLGDQNSMEELLENFALDDFIKIFFGGNYILNSFGAVINQPQNNAYVSKIHKDVRTFAGDFRLLINMLIMLDDFTLENGATYFLSGSHHLPEKPSDELFYQYASRAIGKAGDILLFDSNLWHAAGVNKTTQSRRGLTLTFSRPFFKPQLDYPQLLGEEYGKQISDKLRQILGYNARVPVTLEEYYQPYEKRFYKADQG